MRIHIIIINSVAWVHSRTMPTSARSLSEKLVSTFTNGGVPRGQRDGSLRQYSRFSRPEPLLFLSCSRPTTSQKMW
jgi:hypothetical protein